MSYWRKLLIVVLLVLSLPVQSFAAISMKCVAAHAERTEASPQHVAHVEAAHHHAMHGAAIAHNDRHHDHGDAHHPHSCSICASCCFGTALPAVPVVSVSTNATGAAASFPPSVGDVSFVTDGIERPPRPFLV
ncbi:hypothetical protein C9I57_11955 [Trinickia symbiotica]|uniref:DUF2946 domain-containing protein n=1 Tax=Trinickia symbiotica TaxID=863227 RepID=A0A2T3XVJ9_9BURK|nr:hypothetical protein C9I57_11955 [Trinickia symbiotica]